MIKKCELCGKEFDGTGYAKYCSPECRYEGSWIKRKNANSFERICPMCGEKFIAHRADKIFCSNKCVQRNHQLKQKRAKEIVKKCALCGKEFITNNSCVKYCSDECRNIVYANYKEKVKNIVELKREKRAKEIDSRPKEKETCQECGKVFIKNRPFQKFCSEECRVKNANKRNKIPRVEVCGICGKLFEPNRHYLHYCSDKCKIEANERRMKKNKARAVERYRKERERKRRKKEEKLKVKIEKRNGNELLNEINKISKETGLSYGEVKKWYPDLDKIKFMANYLGRKGMKPDEVRTVGRTSMIIV